MRVVMVVLLLRAGVAVADAGSDPPHPRAFVEVEAGLGVASTDSNCFERCFSPPSEIALGHGGAGGGLFFGTTVALVARAHAIAGVTGGTRPLGLFYGAGLQVRVVPLLAPRDYWFVEVVPGRESLGVPDGGAADGFALEVRAGVNLSPVTIAMSSTLMIDAAYESYHQNDLTLVVGFHGDWLTK